MYTSYFPKAFNPYELIHVYLICANQMLRNNAEPKVTTRSQKSYRGAKFPAAEPFHIYRGTKRHAAEPNILPRNQKSYRGAVIYLPRNRYSRAENFCTFGLQ